jgi:hypothetical protein
LNRNIAELDGIVKGLNDSGVKVDRWDIVALNALELPYYYALARKAAAPHPTTHALGNCSATSQPEAIRRMAHRWVN